MRSQRGRRGRSGRPATQSRPEPKTAPQRASDNRHAPLENDSPLKSILWRGPQLRNRRTGDYLHVSDLVGKCIRQKALSQRLKVPLGIEELWDSQLITFDTGEAIGRFIVTKLTENDGRLYGHWRCNCIVIDDAEPSIIGPMHREDAEAHPPCDKCGANYVRYDELHLVCPEYRIQGHADVALWWQDKAYLGEVKSMAVNRWENLRAPLMDHIVQLLFYWWLCRRLQIPVHDVGSILYVSKDWQIGNPYKEYKIDFANQFDSVAGPFMEEVYQYLAFRENGTMPERSCCGQPTDDYAKNCPFVHQCFYEF